jgi:hypothetical protein
MAYWKSNVLKAGLSHAIFLGFLVYCFLEVRGARANVEPMPSIISVSFINHIVFSIEGFIDLLKQIDILFIMFSGFAIFMLLFLSFINRKKESELIFFKLAVICIAAVISLFVFYISVGAKAGPDYCSRIDVMYGIFFYFILFVVLSVIYIVKKMPKLLIVAPLVLAMLFIEITNSRQPYKDPDWTSTPSYQRKYLLNTWINQIKDADINDLSEIVIEVPKANSESNWPHPVDWFGTTFSKTLKAHNIIERSIEIIIVPKEAL